MNKLLLSIFLCISFMTSYHASAAEIAASTLPGHYYLNGITEVGSELVLGKNGKFEWILAYGNIDAQASGDWHVHGESLLLVSDTTMKKVQFRLQEESKQIFRKGAEKGVWVATVGIAETGPVGGMEVLFEASSGKRVTTVSLENGDAIVSMPESERWARIGLRRKGSADEFQWIVIPPKRSRERIAAFDITNPEVLAHPAFKELSLRIEKTGLRVMDAENGLSSGIYMRSPRN